MLEANLFIIDKKKAREKINIATACELQARRSEEINSANI